MNVNIKELETILLKLKDTIITDEYIINDLNNEIRYLNIILERNKLVEEEKELRKPTSLLIKNSIFKYCKDNNKCIFTKTDQSKMKHKLYYLNNKKDIGFISALKLSEIPYLYVDNYKEWKDVIIFPDTTIRNLYKSGELNEKQIKF